MHQMRDDMKYILSDEKKIQETCDRLAAQINQDYPDHDRELVFVIVLKGSVLFAADLIRRVKMYFISSLIWCIAIFLSLGVFRTRCLVR